MSTRLPLFVLFVSSMISGAADWPRFRGPNGSGIAPDDKPVPVEWSATKNLKWKTALPGPGSSSPIVVANGHMYHVGRRGEVLVVKLGPKFELISRNTIEGDTSDHSATPAISNGQLFLRSAKMLYCIGG